MRRKLAKPSHERTKFHENFLPGCLQFHHIICFFQRDCARRVPLRLATATWTNLQLKTSGLVAATVDLSS